jgi:uncharacterized protein (TIRG00374 family)
LRVKSENREITILKNNISFKKDGITREIYLGFFSVMKNLDLSIFIIFIPLHIVILILGAIRFKWLLASQNIEVNFKKTIKINTIGIFFNNFLPGFTGGDLMRAYYVTKEDKGTTKSFVVVMMDRIIGLSILVIIATIILSFQIGKKEFQTSAIIILSFFVCVCIGFLGIFFFPENFYKGKDGLLFRIMRTFCEYNTSKSTIQIRCNNFFNSLVL